MTLSLQAVDHIFNRMTATYGRDFTARWTGLSQNAVKTSWAHELAGQSMETIAWALENLPERAPNVLEFRNICRRAPIPDAPRLEAPKANPERVRAELEKLGASKAKAVHQGDRYWAHRIVQRHKDGAKVSPAVLSMARSALGGV